MKANPLPIIALGILLGAVLPLPVNLLLSLMTPADDYS
jgi:hypothetical protein